MTVKDPKLLANSDSNWHQKWYLFIRFSFLLFAFSRHKKPVAKSNTGFLFNGNDPYLMEDVTEKIFPQLNLEGRKPATVGSNACLQLITLKEGDRDVMFPSLSTEQNYPQLLSELVMHI